MNAPKPTQPYVVTSDGGVYYVLRTLKLDRNKKIVEMFAAGMSKTEIAAEFGITRPRVHQILQRMARMESLLAGTPS